MNKAFTLYVVLWGTACLLAALLAIHRRRSLELFQARYGRFLFQRWKVLTFVLAATGLILIAPYTGDPTWDYVDATFMSVLTFLTAPWVVGTLYLALHCKRSWVHAYVAMCLWLFSSSWSYDLYLLLREGYYPLTWLPNLFASSVLYLSAGLLWNLDWREGRGVVFAFTQDGWPERGYTNGFPKIAMYALPFMILAVGCILPFLLS